MGVYIPKMRMPHNCSFCPCARMNISGNGIECSVVDFYAENLMPQKERMDICPLVELPPHGRLIDANALKEKSVEMQEHLWNKINDVDANIIMEDDVRFRLYEEMEDYINNAPTIITAEGEDG